MDEQAIKEAQQKEFESKIAETITGTMEKHVPGIVEKAVDEKLNAKVAELGLDKIDLKHGNFPGFSADDKELSKKQRASEFFKAVFRKDMKKLADMNIKAMSEGDDSAGGFLVPEEVMAEVDRVANNYGLIRKLSRRIPMSRDTLNFPTLGTSPSVTWPGEATDGTDGSPTLKNVKLNAKTAVGLSPITNELLADANLNVVDMLLELFAEQLAGAEDSQGLAGVGAPFTGILNDTTVNNVTAASGHDTFAEVDLDDLRDCITQIKQTALPGSVWVMHRAVWAIIQKIKENSQHIVAFANQPNVVSGAPAGGLLTPAGYLWGYPVYTSDYMPSVTAVSTNFIVFGNFKHFYFGDRMQTAVDISKEATVGSVNAFASNQSIVRVLERVALNVGVGEAFSVLATAAS